MEQFGMFEAKTRFSQIVRQVKKTGRSVIVTSRGEHMVAISPLNPPISRRSKSETIAAVQELRKRLPKQSHQQNKADITYGRR